MPLHLVNDIMEMYKNYKAEMYKKYIFERLCISNVYQTKLSRAAEPAAPGKPCRIAA